MMLILDFYPLKGFFHPGETLSFRLVLKASQAATTKLNLCLFSLQNCVQEKELQINYQNGTTAQTLDVSFTPELTCGGYALNLQVEDQKFWTAFDVQKDWLAFPRYGFLSDFSAHLLESPELINERLENLAKYHLTGLQFYDWQYRHDQLVAPSEDYLDPLQRLLSLKTIHSLISEAHQVNMAVMPYLAVYGASIEFWRKHPDWGMYDAEGQPLLFEDFLGLMNPAPGSAWTAHLAAQCRDVLKTLAFDGLHIDQYGDPKQAWSITGEEINLPAAFVSFINQQKQDLQVPVIFNAVGNWPIEALAESQADLMYIEVWPPTPRFADLRQIVENARSLSGGKPVIIPIYIPAEQKTNLLLADAVIAASGGTHLELGDDLKLLSDPYFPESETLAEDYLKDLRPYWDFITAYQAVLGPEAENITLKTDLPQSVFCIARRKGNLLALNLIQLSAEDCWTEVQQPRTCLSDLPLEFETPARIEALCWASPDLANWQLQPLEFAEENGRIKCCLPALTHWSLLLVQLFN